jgi:hypothetical protein
MTVRGRIGRELRNLAHRVDPQPPAGMQAGMYFMDFVRGEVWLDGKRISRSKPRKRRAA